MPGTLRTTTLATAFIAFSLAGTPAADETVAVRTLATPAEPSVTILQPRLVQGVLGREVRSSVNENMGRIVDIVVDRRGQVRAAVIDFGGFLGVGSRKIAVDWNALHFDPDGHKRDVVTLALTREHLRDAPEYKDKHSVVVLGASGGLSTID
jgi:PRC-barrel domain